MSYRDVLDAGARPLAAAAPDQAMTTIDQYLRFALVDSVATFLLYTAYAAVVFAVGTQLVRGGFPALGTAARRFVNVYGTVMQSAAVAFFVFLAYPHAQRAVKVAVAPNAVVLDKLCELDKNHPSSPADR